MWMGGVCAGPPPICVTVWDEKEIWAQYRISRGTISPSVGKSFSKLCLWANQSHHFGHIYNLWVRDWDGFFHVFIILPPWLPGRGEMEMQGLPTIQPDAHQPMLHHCLSDKDKYKTTMQPAPHQPTLHHYLSDKDKYEDKDNHSARCTPTNITSLSVKQRQIQRQRQRQPCSQLHTNWHYIIVCQTKTNTQTKTKIPTLSDAHQLMSHHCLSDKDKDKDNLTASCTSTDAASLFVSTIPVFLSFFCMPPNIEARKFYAKMWKYLHHVQEIYATTGCDGCDKYQLWTQQSAYIIAICFISYLNGCLSLLLPHNMLSMSFLCCLMILMLRERWW